MAGFTTQFLIVIFSIFHSFNFLGYIRQWLESIEICNPQIARSICRMIPAQCPFAREIKCWNHTLIRIPPLCKLNPFYDQVLMLRFKSLTYLADQCGEDITLYC